MYAETFDYIKGWDMFRINAECTKTLRNEKNRYLNNLFDIKMRIVWRNVTDLYIDVWLAVCPYLSRLLHLALKVA